MILLNWNDYCTISFTRSSNLVRAFRREKREKEKGGGERMMVVGVWVQWVRKPIAWWLIRAWSWFRRRMWQFLRDCFCRGRLLASISSWSGSSVRTYQFIRGLAQFSNCCSTLVLIKISHRHRFVALYLALGADCNGGHKEVVKMSRKCVCIRNEKLQ